MEYAYPHSAQHPAARTSRARRFLAHRDHRRHDDPGVRAGGAQRAHDTHREALPRSRCRLRTHLRAHAAVESLLGAAVRLHSVLRTAPRHHCRGPLQLPPQPHLHPGYHRIRVPGAQGDAGAPLRQRRDPAEARLAAVPAGEDLRQDSPLPMSALPTMRVSRAHSRHGFTLVEILTSLFILGILGLAFVRLITSQSRFAEGQMALRNARSVSRNAMNIMLTDFRMVQDSGGLRYAARDSVTVRVPVAFGLLCANTAGIATFTILPVDSAMTALGEYAGWA